MWIGIGIVVLSPLWLFWLVLIGYVLGQLVFAVKANRGTLWMMGAFTSVAMFMCGCGYALIKDFQRW